MEFEEQIRRVAKDIYEKVLSFVNENKEDDDIYYNYAFIRLNNGQEIRYDFDEKTISVPYSKECSYNRIMGTKIEISEDNTKITLELDNESIPRKKYVSYDTGLNEKIENCQKDNIKLSYKRQLLKQRKMKNELKIKIKHEYNQLNSALCNLTYEKERIHNTDNFNSDVYDIYQSYMYDKEERELANSPETIYPAVKIAVEWWANKIVITDEQDIFIRISSENEEPLEPITAEQLAKFKEVLAKKIMLEMEENNGDVVKIGVYDSPMIILYDSLEEAGISENRVPKHPLTMYIRTYWIEVEEYSEFSEIYDSTTEEDIEEIKQIHLKQISNGTSYVLKSD